MIMIITESVVTQMHQIEDLETFSPQQNIENSREYVKKHNENKTSTYVVYYVASQKVGVRCFCNDSGDCEKFDNH